MALKNFLIIFSFAGMVSCTSIKPKAVWIKPGEAKTCGQHLCIELVQEETKFRVSATPLRSNEEKGEVSLRAYCIYKAHATHTPHLGRTPQPKKEVEVQSVQDGWVLESSDGFKGCRLRLIFESKNLYKEKFIYNNRKGSLK